MCAVRHMGDMHDLSQLGRLCPFGPRGFFAGRHRPQRRGSPLCASSQQIKKKNVRVAAKATSKKRVVAAAKPVRRQIASAAPIFRPPKAPAQRHYAVDGSTFYADGVRVRAAGLELLESSAVSSMGKQKLQQLLDSGRVSIEPLGTKDGDVTLARVRIDGQDVSELASAR
jgi:hypothetical protein